MSTVVGYLNGQHGELSGLRLAIPEAGLVIGREPKEADVVLEDTMVSRRHAQLALHDGNRVFLLDLNSTNGTFVNGRKITLPVQLAANDKVDFGGKGRAVFVFETADTPSMTGLLNQVFGENFAPVEWKVGDNILGIYEVTGILGQGGMGRVYKVHHKSWNMDLAVKSPLPGLFTEEKAVENFIREAETWVNLNLHPNIVQCFYVRTIGSIPRIFSEYVPGGTLASWIKKRKLTQLDQILDVAIQFAWGLHAAHEQGIVHQDVKPLNVLMTSDGIAKVADFGLARAKPFTGDNAATTPDNMVTMAGIFTRAYCSPEQVLAAKQEFDKAPRERRVRLSRATDIWSWAVSVLEMFTGGIVWQNGLQAPDTLKNYRSLLGPKFVVKMPKELGALLEQCLCVQPDDRPKDMPAIVKKLQAIYRANIGQAYPRYETKAGEHLADSLNNRGLSLVDLGKEPEAVKLFEKALATDPHHLEATYNRGLLLWRSAKTTDDQVIKQLEEVGKSHPGDSRANYLIGLVHLERGDAESAVRVLSRAANEAAQSPAIGLALMTARQDLEKRGRRPSAFEGHSKYVSSVAISPDGRWGLSGSWDNTLRLWELASGQCLRVFVGHLEEVSSVAISPDGRWGVSGSSDRVLRLWDLDSGQCLRTFEGHTEDMSSVAICPDGRSVLTGGWGEPCRLWDLESGRCLRTFGVQPDFDTLTQASPPSKDRPRVESVAVSPDGRWGLSGSSDKTLRLWDLASGQSVRTFEGHSDSVESVAISPDGRWGLSGSSDNTLRVWDLANGQCLRVFAGHSSSVKSVAFSPDGRRGLSGGLDRTVRLWDLTSGQCLRTFKRHLGSVSSVAISPDGRWGLSGGWDNTIRQWSLVLPFVRSSLATAIPQQSRELLRQRDEFVRLIDTAEANLLKSEMSAALHCLTEGRAIRGYERDTRAMVLLERVACYCKKTAIRGGWQLRAFEGHSGGVNSVAISPDGRWGLSGSSDKTLRLWDLACGRCRHTLEYHIDSVNSVAISPDGCWGLSGGGDFGERSVGNQLHQWVLDCGEFCAVYDGHTYRVTSVAISPDGRWGLSGSESGLHTGEEESGDTLRLWDLASGECLREFEELSESVLSVAITPDGHWGLSGSRDGMVRLWDLATSQCLREFDGHSGRVNSVAVTPDGCWGLSGSSDGTLRLWNLASGKCLRAFEGHSGSVSSIAISPDGNRVLLGCGSQLWLWQLDWEYEFPGWADWHEDASPYLNIFLTLHCPILTDDFTRVGKPTWTEEQFQGLIKDLQHRGYGWLRPDGVRRELDVMARNWGNPPAR
ncbi:MAG: Serine/threonine-protein kinase PknD [Verrucomicrobiae bacterium]|nr:Serine/threonine-protein kinase PknD [Verrucomicrobiae bacterium]